MKVVRNNANLPKIGQLFRARGGQLCICKGILYCDRITNDGECRSANECTGYKAQLSEGQPLRSSYCILFSWEVD